MKSYFGFILSIVIIALTSSSVASQNCSRGALSSGANRLTSKADDSGKRHGTIEEAKVKWEVNMNANKKIAKEYDITKKQLQIKQQDGNWEDFTPKRQVTYNGAYTWTVPRIPCLDYSYRVIVPSIRGETSKNCFETDTTTLAAETTDRIRKAKFVPSKVENINIIAHESSLSLTWDKSLCAEEYHVYVYMDNEDLDDREEQSKTVQNSNLAEAKFFGLHSCTNYNVEIIPAVQGDVNDKNINSKIFHTKPDSRSAGKLDLSDLTPNKNSVSLNFYNFMQGVNCLNKFDIKVCDRWDEDKPDSCSETKNVEMNINNLQYVKENLNSCSKYTLLVTPKYDGIMINPKKVEFTTTFENKGSYDNNLTAGINDVKLKVRNIDCFESYTVSYRIVSDTIQTDTEYDSGEENEWKIKNGTLDSNEIMIENLLPSSRYKLRMEVQKGDQKVLVLSGKDFETSSMDVVRSGLMENSGTEMAEEYGNSTKSDGTTSSSKNDTTTSSGDDSTATESADTSNENSESTATSGSYDSSSDSNKNDNNGSDGSKTTQKTSDNDENSGNSGSTSKNSDVDDASSGVIVAVVVIILLLIGAGVGYWFVKGKQGGAGKSGSSPEPVQNQKYDQVPAQDIEAN